MMPILARIRDSSSTLAAALLCLAASVAHAQLLDPDPNWTEDAVPPPPAFDVRRTLPIEMPVFMALKFGVDPGTLTITQGSVVRYVMVATSDTGVVNAMYEGIRCTTGEVKTYARYNAGSGWTAVRNSEWRDMRARMPSHHAAEFARQGACQGRAAPQTVDDIVRSLRAIPSNSPS